MSTAQITTLDMKCRQFATQFQCSMIALVLMSVCPLRALAQHTPSHTPTTQHHEMTPDQKSRASALIKIVREATERFPENSDAWMLLGEAFQMVFRQKEALAAYEQALALEERADAAVAAGSLYRRAGRHALPDGRLRLTGADYLLFRAAWDAKNPAPPQLMGQAFHLFDAPNRFGLPPFYTLHVWAWKENPNGAFVNWHPNVSCEAFSGQTF